MSGNASIDSWSGSWPAPAKLNLFLHITGRRPDGYHTLQSVFQFLDYGDFLRFTVTDAPTLTLAKPLPGVPVEQDLCVRAARLLQAAAGGQRGAHIELIKQLPLGGGLGGGSSDAATVLVALNRLWGIGFSVDRLAELGLRLGADVPVFVRGQAAWAEGIGERLTPITPPEPWYLVLVPNVTVSTAEIFRDAELTRNTPPITIPDFLLGAGHNDCEALVRKRYPAVDRALDWLSQHAPARMTGTGACVFAPFASESLALRVQQALPTGWQSFVARGCNRSPLLQACEMCH